MVTKKKYIPLSSGHRACAGCGQIIAARIVAEALGPNVIIANATGCLEVTTTQYPESAWGMPWIHSLFENTSAIASGIKAAIDYKIKIRHPKSDIRNPKVVAQGGDGATFDIGFGLISGMWQRNENILYICYDNEAYANTGIQASGSTPAGTKTTTTPAGSYQKKKDMVAIALAHKLNYVAQTTVGFPEDIVKKVKKALTIKGPGYIQILCPCVPGWKIRSDQTIKIGKLAAQTAIYPLLEYVNGKQTKSSIVFKQKIKAEEYFKLQGRYKT
ncbi:MAG: thiamine pyrophosphate-dependent enzyme [Patescibacteria group bacterium]|nr:hypothetical protein [Patescibacteria group bacterium]